MTTKTIQAWSKDASKTWAQEQEKTNDKASKKRKKNKAKLEESEEHLKAIQQHAKENDVIVCQMPLVAFANTTCFDV
jgi:hypothetical protein